MGKKILIVLSVILVSLVMFLVINSHNNLSSRDNISETTVTMSSDGPPTVNDKLERLDADLDHAINTCLKASGSIRISCTDTIEETWWIECAEYYDKLDVCKNGKIENFLKGERRPT